MLKLFRYVIFLCFFQTNIIYAEPYSDKVAQTSKIIEQNPEYVPEDVAIFDEKNEQHFLEEYEGKTVLLVFWATWCAPCVAEMADLDALQKDFRKTSLIILPISEDYVGIDHVKSFYQINNITHLPAMYDHKNSLFKAFGVVGLPTSILIDTEGRAVVKFSGAVNWYDEKIRDIILKYIPGNPPLPRNSYKDNAVNYIQSPVTDVKKETEENKASEVEQKIESNDDEY